MSPTLPLLVAVPLKGAADEICYAAADIARRSGAQVTLLHVMKLPPGVPASATVESKGTSLSAADLLRQDATRHTDRLVELLRSLDVDTERVLEFGAPSETIVEVARQIGAWMIVVGDERRSGLNKLFQARHIDGILAGSPCPVLVVPAAETVPEELLSTGQSQLAAEVDG